MIQYYPVPLHIHSVWERNASMEGHFFNAQKLGIHHMYITDHDVRMGPRENHISCFDFSKGLLKIEEPSEDPLRPRWQGFSALEKDDGTDFRIQDGVLIMEAKGNSTSWSNATLIFDTSQKRHEYALLANVFMCLGMKILALDEDTRIIIDVELSQRPPEFKHGHIMYVFGNAKGLSSPYHAVIPMQPKNDFSEYSFQLLRDAASVGGGDNVLRTIRFTVSARRGKTAKLLLNKLSLSWDVAFEEGRKRQQELADTLGKKYGVTPYVTSEITGAGPHKICFSTSVPILNYAEHGYRITDEEAMQHVLSYGGIYARNHPLEKLKDYLKLSISDSDLEIEIQKHINYFVQNRAWNAAMIEVGFPEGREGFSLDLHLRLWDTLSKEGIFITGYGDSDNHTNDTLWFENNNFLAYIAAEIPSEKAFIQSMKEGNVYTGDPVYLQKMQVSFTTKGGMMMGQVAVSDTPDDVILKLSGLPKNSKVVWTANGKTVKTSFCENLYEDTLPLPIDEKVNFVRVALYHDDRCIMLTNPIYRTTNQEIQPHIPAERMYHV